MEWPATPDLSTPDGAAEHVARPDSPVAASEILHEGEHQYPRREKTLYGPAHGSPGARPPRWRPACRCHLRTEPRFSLHVEDYHLHSLGYLLSGALKVWTIIEPSATHRLEALLGAYADKMWGRQWLGQPRCSQFCQAYVYDGAPLLLGGPLCKLYYLYTMIKHD